ncbi:FAD:protein FMN transferase [Candidatus Omnitrophota bacterium]
MKLSGILVIGLSAGLLCGYANQNFVTQRRVLLGTVVEITVADKDKSRQLIDQAIKGAFSEIERVENLLSRFKSQSEISQINTKGEFEPVQVSPETIALIESSVEFSRQTNGAFDITILPLAQAWGFNQKEKDLPGQLLLQQARSKVGYKNIKIDSLSQSVYLAHPGMKLDLGAIAKGYAVDQAVAVLKAADIDNALVNAGGDIYALGRPEKSRKWQVAVQHPRKKNVQLTVLEIENMAVATSGDYENFIEYSGERFGHIIDPKTGASSAAGPLSVTVLSPDCLQADALATSIFLLSPDQGLKLVAELDNTEVLIASFSNQDQGEQLDLISSPGLNQLQFSHAQNNF